MKRAPAKPKRVVPSSIVSYGVNDRGIIYTEVKSSDGKKKYRVAISVATGRIDCTCEAFQFKCAAFRPKVDTLDRHCKHIKTWHHELSAQLNAARQEQP
jgi:hypothetical protein